MSRYDARLDTIDGFAAAVLRDNERGARAEVAPGIGNNVYRFECEGTPLILPPADLRSLRHETFAAFKYGTPILFPPNRVKGAQFTFGGREYRLPLNEPPHHHLHGEICSRAWEVVDIGASEERGAYVTSRFRYADHPDLMAYFPHPLAFTVTYRLSDGTLHMETSIANEGADAAPFAFGLHPYFPLPFEAGEPIVLKAPAIAEWPVTNEAFVVGLPESTAFSRALIDGVDISRYPPLGCSLVEFDPAAGDPICRIEMKESGYALLYRFDRRFRYAVLFRPNWASAFSVEPYTYVTDAFNLPYAHERTGAKAIAAGERLTFATSLRMETDRV